MKLLELFCGTKSIGKEFEKVGFNVVSLDFDAQFDATITADILTIPDDYFSGFDVVWASIPCTCFSVASLGHHWTGGKRGYIPATDAARTGIEIVRKTLAIIKHVDPKLFWIENPRGMMRKLPEMQALRVDTATYCQYEVDKPRDEKRMKPTDFFHNTNWRPRPICRNGDLCHVAAPRGSRTGTQGIKGARDRSVIPAELCKELAEFAASRLVTGPVVQQRAVFQPSLI